MTSKLLRLRAVQTQDDGAVLLLALIFIGVVGALVAAIIPYTQSGVSEAAVARNVRSVQNAVDGAIGGAIEKVRPSLNFGGPTGRCPTYNAPAYKTVVGSVTTNTNITVTCTNAVGFVNPFADVPPYAIVTTQGGITLSGKTLSVDGGIYSAGPVTVSPPSAVGAQNGPNYLVTGDVFTTTGGCDNLTVTTGTADCPIVAGDPGTPPVNYDSPLGATAGAAQSTVDAMTKDPVGKCRDAGLVTFQPGYYSQAPQVDTATPSAADPDACGSTPPSTWLLAPCAGYVVSAGCSASTSPGLYYFDFADSSYAGYGNNAVWDLDALKVHLIAGTLRSNWPTDADGSKCNSKALGSQIILGGPTQVTTGNNSSIELCASPTDSTAQITSTKSQRIAVYGLSHDARYGLVSPTGPRGDTGLQSDTWSTTATTTSGDSAWTSPDGSHPGTGAEQSNDNTGGLTPVPNVATATFSDVGTYGVDLNTFPNVTGGSLVEDAVLHVRHYETALTGNVATTLTVSYGDNTPSDTCTVPTGGTVATPRNDTIDLLTDCTKNTLKNAIYRWKAINGLKVTYEMAATKQGNNLPTGTAGIDGVGLATKLVTPALEAERCQSGVSACNSYSNSSSTAVDNTFFIGTIYTPTEPLNVVVHNFPNTIFRRGVVASSVTINANASSKQSDSPFELPHSTSPTRAVLFTAMLTGTTKPLARALVFFTDCAPAPSCATASGANDDVNIVFAGRQVTIHEWTSNNDLGP